MSIEAIAAVNSIASTETAMSAGSVKNLSFAEWMADQVSTTDANIKHAEQLTQKFAVGETDNLHEVMIALSKAKTQFEFAVEVRNKMLEGFQEVMRMSI